MCYKKLLGICISTYEQKTNETTLLQILISLQEAVIIQKKKALTKTETYFRWGALLWI